MATKRYSQESFHIDMPNGKTLSFYCWTTSTRMGFCHTVWCCDTDQTTKVSYSNRTWECYRYQTALRNAFKKLPKEERDVCNLWDVAKENKEHLECEAFVKAFEQVYKETPQSLKDKLADSDITINSEEDANTLIGLMKLATVLNS